mgnify:FL=1|tara:strand:- start:198 stop:416 length:219 start_codon:yes stop_codon:yes gene_type:complete
MNEEERMRDFLHEKEKVRIAYELEDKFMDIAADYKGLVSREAFTNIAWDMWGEINGERGVRFPKKGDHEILH